MGTQLVIAKVPGYENRADVVTKYLNSDATQRHLDKHRITRSGGRAQSAPTLAGLAGPRCKVTDEWASGAADEHEVARVHRLLRRELFTPLRVQGAPPASDSRLSTTGRHGAWRIETSATSGGESSGAP